MDKLLEQLRKLIVEPSIKRGEIYLNVKNVLGFPCIVNEIADRIGENFEGDVSCVVGYIADALNNRMRPLSSKSTKTYGN